MDINDMNSFRTAILDLEAAELIVSNLKADIVTYIFENAMFELFRVNWTRIRREHGGGGNGGRTVSRGNRRGRMLDG